MYPKYDSISAYLQLLDIDIMFFTETWLSKKITDSMVCPRGYSVIRADRLNQQGGGVAVLYKDNLRVIEVDSCFNDLQPLSSNFEFLCIDLFNHKGVSIRLICFYIPPNFSKCKATIQAVCTILHRLSSPLKPCYVVGDFNLPKIDWSIPTTSGGPSHQEFLSFCSSNCWTQCINEATHKKQNILDLLLCNQLAYCMLISHEIKPQLTSTCDHKVISFDIDFSSTKKAECKPAVPLYMRGDYASMSEKLININWTDFNIYQFNLQDYYDKFISVIQDLMDKFIPKSKPFTKKRGIPKHIQVLLKKKIRIYKEAKSNPELKSKYKTICKQYEIAMQKWVDNKEKHLCKNPTSKKFYGYINRKLKAKRTLPPLMNEDLDTLCFDDADKADLLNLTFQRSFVEDDGKVPNLNSRNCAMNDFNIDATDILQGLKKMSAKISRTPENIPSYVIKQIGPSILKPLEIIFNYSLRTNTIPKQWKTSYVVPVFKKGSRKLPGNYRPISLTSGFSRLLETIIHSRISAYLLHNSLLSASQFGFLANRSSGSQLLSCINDWLWDYVNNISTDVIYLDISKAFDSVSHAKLIHVIKSYGISPNIVKWTKEFLRDRQQRVCLGTSVSAPLPVKSGVPQGGGSN